MTDDTGDFVEQRKFLRLNSHEVGHPTCMVPLESGREIELQLTDISAGGFGATIPEYLARHFHKGCEFPHCRVSLEGAQDVSVRVTHFWMLHGKSGEASMRAGFEFTSPVDWVDSGLQDG